MTAAAPRLKVHPHCLLFFVEKSGHEEFADPNHPVFALGGCALLASAVEPALRAPWRKLKDDFFGGANKPLHAGDLRSPRDGQLQALGDYFRKQAFARLDPQKRNKVSRR
jgi:hypothetical protein